MKHERLCVTIYQQPYAVVVDMSRCVHGLVFFRSSYSGFGLAILLAWLQPKLSLPTTWSYYYCDRRSIWWWWWWWNGDEIRPWSIGSDTIVLPSPIQSSPAPMGDGKQRRRRFVLARGSFGFHQRREGRPANPTATTTQGDAGRPAETFCMSRVFYLYE